MNENKYDYWLNKPGKEITKIRNRFFFSVLPSLFFLCFLLLNLIRLSFPSSSCADFV
jgi:hypothetical protein